MEAEPRAFFSIYVILKIHRKAPTSARDFPNGCTANKSHIWRRRGFLALCPVSMTAKENANSTWPLQHRLGRALTRRLTDYRCFGDKGEVEEVTDGGIALAESAKSRRKKSLTGRHSSPASCAGDPHSGHNFGRGIR